MVQSDSTINDAYLVPAAKTEREIKVKGSRFIATIDHVAHRDDAEQYYSQVKKQYYNATHNCMAYRIDGDEYRFLDDGEPSGTAGKPILQALDAYQLLEVICVVTRYFGGTKLGTGGLIRAYGEATREALKQLKTRTCVKRSFFMLEYGYELENTVRRMLDEFGGIITDSIYTDHVNLNVGIPRSRGQNFREQLFEAAQSQITITNAEQE